MAVQANDGHDHLDASSGSAAHSATETLTQASLSAALQAVGGADRVFFADLNELNNSDAEGGALLALKGGQLTVITAAKVSRPASFTRNMFMVSRTDATRMSRPSLRIPIATASSNSVRASPPMVPSCSI